MEAFTVGRGGWAEVGGEEGGVEGVGEGASERRMSKD